MDDLKSLEKLILCGCSKLKWLKKFPSTVRYINARFCFSLKPSPALVKLSGSSQPRSQSCLYDESSSELAFTILYRYLQGLLFCKTDYEACTKRKEDVTITEFQIIVCGFEIPSWLTHQSVWNSISMELPFGVTVNGWDSLYVHQHQWDLALEFV
ncbi:hypothetical protein SO802_014477 [Lithocarpus litseifolius]|uniref:Uncharacterized protein n=1 Tax=Lithocarpus litseifolius TaxID=425828 RepID=A0AAW2CW78_9ROSI